MSDKFEYFSHNGKVLPIEHAVVPLNSVEYSYGFGVYETIRVTKGFVMFGSEHCERLMNSARIIGLEHMFSGESILKSIDELVKANSVGTCNIKVLLIGGSKPEAANLYILCLNPLFPDRKLYKTGAHCIARQYERQFPHAKTLNMLPSYLAYRDAKQAGAYDALLINNQGQIIEGTRTNFFCVKGKTIYSPPSEEILLGVTRDKVLQIAKQTGLEIVEQSIDLADLLSYDGAFLTSTSSKIVPIISVDDFSWKEIPTTTKELMSAFGKFLETA